jgi:hypothetical protein
LQTRVSDVIPHGLTGRTLFSAIILKPNPLQSGTDRSIPSGLNFAVTTYLDNGSPTAIRIAVTLLTGAAQQQINVPAVTVRWSGVSR